MRKITFYILFITTCFLNTNANSQQLADTIFVLKESIDSNIHKIFIEPNKNSIYYESIGDFHSFPKSSKKEKLKLGRLPKKWVSLHLYKEKFYLYAPCDYCFNSKIGFIQNEISFENCEIISYKIDGFEKINNLKYTFNYNNYNKIDIYIIDKKRGIAVFKYKNADNEINYQLMADLKKIKKFQIIINDCRDSKTKEFEFETIDFEKIITKTEN